MFSLGIAHVETRIKNHIFINTNLYPNDIPYLTLYLSFKHVIYLRHIMRQTKENSTSKIAKRSQVDRLLSFHLSILLLSAIGVKLIGPCRGL